MISYYELLGMIKDVNFPSKVKYDGNLYVWTGRNYYGIETNSYLSCDIDEVDMVEKNIKIIEVLNEKEKIQDNQK